MEYWTDQGLMHLRRLRAALRQEEFETRQRHRGSLLAWGRNHFGQLGVGDRVDRHTPQPVAFPGLPGPDEKPDEAHKHPLRPSTKVIPPVS